MSSFTQQCIFAVPICPLPGSSISTQKGSLRYLLLETVLFVQPVTVLLPIRERKTQENTRNERARFTSLFYHLFVLVVYTAVVVVETFFAHLVDGSFTTLISDTEVVATAEVTVKAEIGVRTEMAVAVATKRATTETTADVAAAEAAGKRLGTIVMVRIIQTVFVVVAAFVVTR